MNRLRDVTRIGAGELPAAIYRMQLAKQHQAAAHDARPQLHAPAPSEAIPSQFDTDDAAPDVTA